MKIKTLFIIFSVSFLTVTAQEISLETFGTGFSSPVDIKNAGDSRLFVVERHGTIKILNDDGTVESTDFLDIDTRVGSTTGERGLLGVAFHPDYTFSNGGFVFVNYTDNSGDTVISRFFIATNSSTADDTSEEIILTITQPFTNHNGGSIAFGPDDYLYIGTGDGGSGGDPGDRAQNGNNLLGKMLRIDIDNGLPYTIPADNPFISNSSVLNEIWAIGLRNPWKFSFDKNTGDLWIGDVGQEVNEEISFAANDDGGLNFGWRCYEGNSTYNTSGTNCSSGSFTFPIAEYTQLSGRCSITGGYRYRGSEFSSFDGLYFFSDYCTSEIGIVDATNTITFTSSSAGNISTFGEDINGELYAAGLNDGTVYKIVDSSLSVDEFDLNEQISLYPNPVNDKVYYQVLNDIQISSIVFVNSLGKQILVKNEINIEGGLIDVSLFSDGVYFVKINLENEKKIYKKLIIN